MIAFDTNIAIYIATNHPEFKPASLKILRRAQTVLGSSVSTVLCAEILSHKSLNTAEKQEGIHDFLQSFDPIIIAPVNEGVSYLAAHLLRENQFLKLPDALHLASASYNGAYEFWTNDRNLLRVSVPNMRIKSLV